MHATFKNIETVIHVITNDNKLTFFHHVFKEYYYYSKVNSENAQ